MTCDFYALACGEIADMQPYSPGKPVEELEREYGVRDSIKLASNENPLGPSPDVLRVLRKAVGKKSLALYPDAGGHALKQVLAHKYAVDAACITLGNGSNDLLDMIARVFAGPGHAIMYSQYAFLVYPLLTKIIGARGIEVPARNWGCDLEGMRAALTPDTRIIFIANPNNPTGTWLGKEHLRAFLNELPDNVIVVIDEAYFEYVNEAAYPNTLEWLPDYPNLIVTRTFSKAYGLAGLRVGFAVSHPHIADLLNRVRQPFNVNNLAMLAAEAALQDEAHLQESVALNHAGLKQLRDAFTENGLEYIPSAGNFICVDSAHDADKIYQSLLRQGVIVRPVANYGMPRHLRVSVGLPEENARFIMALRNILSGKIE